MKPCLPTSFSASQSRALRDHGLELADSVTIDPHKWFYAPLDAGALLVKDEARLTASFGMKPSYLTNDMDQAKERYQYYVHGFEQSRRGTRRVAAFEFRKSAWSLY